MRNTVSLQTVTSVSLLTDCWGVTSTETTYGLLGMSTENVLFTFLLYLAVLSTFIVIKQEYLFALNLSHLGLLIPSEEQKCVGSWHI